MAEITIKVSPDVMLRQAADVKRSVDNIKRMFESIGKSVAYSRTYWEGSASDVHETKYNKIKESCNDITRRLSKHPDDLVKMAGIYQKTESSAKHDANSLSSNVLL